MFDFYPFFGVFGFLLLLLVKVWFHDFSLEFYSEPLCLFSVISLSVPSMWSFSVIHSVKF